MLKATGLEVCGANASGHLGSRPRPKGLVSSQHWVPGLGPEEVTGQIHSRGAALARGLRALVRLCTKAAGGQQWVLPGQAQR